jgi:alcohol oxidase
LINRDRQANRNQPADNNNLTERDTAIIDDLPDLEYDAQDDKAIEQFIRENIQTTWHSLGTAKMAPRDDMGVVDKDLNVYGVNGM